MGRRRAEEEVVEEQENQTDVAPEEEYVYPYGDSQTHEALADLDKRLKKLGG